MVEPLRLTAPATAPATKLRTRQKIEAIEARQRYDEIAPTLGRWQRDAIDAGRILRGQMTAPPFEFADRPWRAFVDSLYSALPVDDKGNAPRMSPDTESSLRQFMGYVARAWLWRRAFVASHRELVYLIPGWTARTGQRWIPRLYSAAAIDVVPVVVDYDDPKQSLAGVAYSASRGANLYVGAGLSLDGLSSPAQSNWLLLPLVVDTLRLQGDVAVLGTRPPAFSRPGPETKDVHARNGATHGAGPGKKEWRGVGREKAPGGAFYPRAQESLATERAFGATSGGADGAVKVSSPHGGADDPRADSGALTAYGPANVEAARSTPASAAASGFEGQSAPGGESSGAAAPSTPAACRRAQWEARAKQLGIDVAPPTAEFLKLRQLMFAFDSPAARTRAHPPGRAWRRDVTAAVAGAGVDVPAELAEAVEGLLSAAFGRGETPDSAAGAVVELVRDRAPEALASGVRAVVAASISREMRVIATSQVRTLRKELPREWARDVRELLRLAGVEVPGGLELEVTALLVEQSLKEASAREAASAVTRLVLLRRSNGGARAPRTPAHSPAPATGPPNVN